MWKLAVIGPIPTPGMGIASACCECRRGGAEPIECGGFGSGCLGFSRRDALGARARPIDCS